MEVPFSRTTPVRKDSLGRRYRDEPQPTGRRLHLFPRDVRWFEALHRHGPLPTSYLYEFTKHDKVSYKRAQERLGHLYHEHPHYLFRPPQQYHTIPAAHLRSPRQNQLVYDIYPSSLLALKEAGLWRENAPHINEATWKHEFMIACITASAELFCLSRRGFSYLHHDEIVDKIGKLQFPCGDTPLKPDRFFGITYPDGSTRIFLVEADCATEPLRAASFNRKSWERSIKQYKEFIGGKKFHEHFQGLRSGILNLTVTTSMTRAANIRELALQIHPQGFSYLLITHAEEFGPYFYPPRPLTRLFTEPLARPGKEPFTIAKA